MEIRSWAFLTAARAIRVEWIKDLAYFASKYPPSKFVDFNAHGFSSDLFRFKINFWSYESFNNLVALLDGGPAHLRSTAAQDNTKMLGHLSMFRAGFKPVIQCLNGSRRYSASVITRQLYKSISFQIMASNRLLSSSTV
jgi:hypothetical protein